MDVGFLLWRVEDKQNMRIKSRSLKAGQYTNVGESDLSHSMLYFYYNYQASALSPCPTRGVCSRIQLPQEYKLGRFYSTYGLLC